MNDDIERLRSELDTAYRQLEQTASRLLLVNQAGELTSRTHDPLEIGRELLASILDSVFVEQGLVILYSRGGEVFEILTSQGLDEEATGYFEQSEAESTALWISLLREGPVTREHITGAEEWEEGLAEPRFAVYVPLIIEEELVGALVIGDKAGGAAFDGSELSFLSNLGHHAAVALNHARLYRRLEKRLKDLDTLLKISHEITSTLDLDRILRTVVTLASALIDLKYSAIGLRRGGRTGLDASGGEKLPPEGRKALERILEYVVLSGTEVSATAEELPEGEGRELIGAFFRETGTRSFWGTPLKDDQGVMGAYCQVGEGQEPDSEEHELLKIMVNQTTVAVRNAELYHQVPFIGFLEPILEKRRKLWAAGRRRWKRLAVGGAAAVVALLLIRLPHHAGGTATVHPGLELELRAPVAGTVEEVYASEGELLAPGAPVAWVRSLEKEIEQREAAAALERARQEEASARARGDLTAAHRAGIDGRYYRDQVALLQRQSASARLASPFRAVVLTPHLAERSGAYLRAGEVFCEVGALDTLRVEIQVSEKDWLAVRAGQPVKMKFHACAERTFRGEVHETAAAAVTGPDGERLLVATVLMEGSQELRPGMTGVGRIYEGHHSLLWHLTHPILRFFGMRWWSG